MQKGRDNVNDTKYNYISRLSLLVNKCQIVKSATDRKVRKRPQFQSLYVCMDQITIQAPNLKGNLFFKIDQ